MQTYIEHDNGRIYGQHPHFLNCPRDIRHAAFTGFYEYDINNCHYAILAQMAKQANYLTPTIDTYNQDKKTFRANLSHDLDLPLDDIKIVLLSKIYGASDSDKPSTAIPKLIGMTKAKELYQHEIYKSLSIEIKDSRKAILEHHLPNRSGYITNATGKTIHQDNSPLNILSHLITGIEVIAIQAVLVHCETILLVIHDGFISELPMDIDTMEKQIYEQTQYHLSMSGKQITTPAIFNELFNNDKSL